jgi:nitrite reductase/ring-hydroxylating ferredoxin subunit
MADWPDRLNRFIDALQAGRRPPRNLASTPEEIEDLRIAARLAGARPAFNEPDPAFLESLRSQLQLTRPHRKRLNRAGLLRAAGFWVAGIASGLGLEWGMRQVGPLVAAQGHSSGDLGLVGGKWFAVGPLAAIPDNSVQPFDAGAIPTFVLRDGDNVRALSRICTHMGCTLRFDADWRELICPCHGAQYELDGKPDPDYKLATLSPLPAIPVRVDKGTVYVLGA